MRTACADATCRVVPDSIDVSARRLRNSSERRRDVCEHVPLMKGSAAPAFVLDGKWTHKERRGEEL